MEQNIGAFVCNESVFNRILRLEKRRGEKFLFMAISFDELLKENILEDIFDDLIHLLRTKDVISKNEKQIFILLNNASVLYGEDIVKRLKNLFEKSYPKTKPTFSIKKF